MNNANFRAGRENTPPGYRRDRNENPMEHISSPYNFVPLADHVHLPAWGEHVSHDIPFADGVCGEIELFVTAHAPILVGGEQTRKLNAAGEVNFYKHPNGKYAIPGSSLKGMVRAVLEMATFSRLRQVDDMRYALRDINGAFVKSVYHAAVVGQQSAGFMSRAGNKIKITPCSFAQVPHEELERWLGISCRYVFDKSQREVSSKYKAWTERTKDGNSLSLKLQFDTEAPIQPATIRKAVKVGNGKTAGTLVLTGQISDRSSDKGNRRGKHNDFVFYDELLHKTYEVAEHDWQNFLFAHGDQIEQGQGAWKGYWKDRFYQGERVPVFYVPHGTQGQATTGQHIGLALLLKLAGDFSVHSLIGKQAMQHLETSDGFDFADLLFGATENIKSGSLKSRVAFLPAVANGSPKSTATAPTILNNPKPSYFPNYLEQTQKPLGKLESSANAAYSTYVDRAQTAQPSIRGWKRYPAHASSIGVQALNPDQVKNTSVQTILHPLDKGTTFKTTMIVHNLRRVELGAVLWALTWGDAGAESLRHSIGMGKPFGFGQVSVKLGVMDNLRANDSAQPNIDGAQVLIDEFIVYMNENCRPEWIKTPQLKNLLAMADPAIGDDPNQRQFKGELKHMVLNMSTNEFTAAKKVGLVLPPYALGGGITRKPIKQQTAAPNSRAASGGVVPPNVTAPTLPQSLAHSWLDEEITKILRNDGGKRDSALQSGYLQLQWSKIPDATLKTAVRALIKKAWQDRGWWDTPPKPDGKLVKAQYERGDLA